MGHVLPSFTPDLAELDVDGIRHDARTAVDHGFALVLCVVDGTLSPTEATRFVATVCQEVDIPVGCTVSADTFDDGRRLLDDVRRAGLGFAVLDYPMTFVPVDQDEFASVLARECDSAGVPVVLSFAPFHGFQRLHPSGVPLDALDRLADLEPVVGVMVAAVDAGTIFEVFERVSDRLAVSAEALAMAPLLAAVYGQSWITSVGVEALQSPQRPNVVEMARALGNGDALGAMSILWTVKRGLDVSRAQLMGPAMGGAPHWPKVKYLQWCVGGNGGALRQPTHRLYARELREVRAAYAEIGIDVPDSDDEFPVGRHAAASGARAASGPRPEGRGR
jgi:4-hydroxy-tetrahydrodipicolinate synthase